NWYSSRLWNGLVTLVGSSSSVALRFASAANASRTRPGCAPGCAVPLSSTRNNAHGPSEAIAGAPATVSLVPAPGVTAGHCTLTTLPGDILFALPSCSKTTSLAPDTATSLTSTVTCACAAPGLKKLSRITAARWYCRILPGDGAEASIPGRTPQSRPVGVSTNCARLPAKNASSCPPGENTLLKSSSSTSPPALANGYLPSIALAQKEAEPLTARLMFSCAAPAACPVLVCARSLSTARTGSG